MLILSTGDENAASGKLVIAPPIACLGQILTILAAFFFTAQILVLDHFGRRAEPVRLTAVMLLTAGVVNLIVGLIILLAVLIVARQPADACAEGQAGYSSTP